MKHAESSRELVSTVVCKPMVRVENNSIIHWFFEAIVFLLTMVVLFLVIGWNMITSNDSDNNTSALPIQ